MRLDELLGLIALIVFAVVVASALTFGLFPESVAVPVFPPRYAP